jgi:endonuclease/exonuclease/phosphatase family metal-dependent hydrolase
MRYLSIIFIIVMVSGCVGEDQKGSVRMMTFNVRYDNPSDGINRWENRRNLVVETIVEDSPDIIGMQEVLVNQLNDLDTLLPWYDYVGVARGDGLTEGEFSPIFYKMSRFVLKSQGTFWLSETPDSTGSIGWDAALPRIATWAVFFDKHVQREFLVINTHFDHLGERARVNSARQLVRFVRTREKRLPTIVCGDFNFDEQSEGYQVLTTNESVSLNDTKMISVLSPKGPAGTFNGFNRPEGTKRIDHIYVSHHWKAYEHEALQVIHDGVYVSDHWPVSTNIKITTHP